MPGPGLNYNDMGWARTGKRRIRNGWFGAVIEHMVEHRDGRRRWVKFLDSIPLEDDK